MNKYKIRIAALQEIRREVRISQKEKGPFESQERDAWTLFKNGMKKMGVRGCRKIAKDIEAAERIRILHWISNMLDGGRLQVPSVFSSELLLLYCLEVKPEKVFF